MTAKGHNLHPARLILGDDQPSPEWMDRAACAGPFIDPEWFFPFEADDAGKDFAKTFCNECPVQAECLQHAFTIGDQWAVLGGTTPQDRGRLKRKRARARQRAAGRRAS
jgi:WhiB family redox-sensing transcriptional regulator